MVKYISSFDFSGESEVMQEFLKSAENAEKEKLYDVDTGEDRTGEELIEKAHPDIARIIDSYIVDGGVVENQVEQQRVSREIAEKMPDNRFSRMTMASAELAEELIVLAEEMSIRGEKDLAKYAKDLSEKLKKEAIGPLAVAGIVAVPVILGAWFYASLGTEPVDYGPGKNLRSTWNAIENYKEEKLSTSVSDNEAIKKTLESIQSKTVDMYKTRESYIETIDKLSNRLESIAQASTKNAPTTKDVENVLENPQGKEIVEMINKFNSEYNKYILNIAIPLLGKDYNYLKSYFDMTKNMVSSELGERSTTEQAWEKTKEFFGYFAKSEEDHVLDSIKAAAISLKNDIKLKTMEKNRFIDSFSKKIETDMQHKFKLEPPPTNKEEKPTTKDPNTK